MIACHGQEEARYHNRAAIFNDNLIKIDLFEKYINMACLQGVFVKMT